MEKLIHGKNCIGICKETAESEGEEGKRNGEARAEEEDERSVERTIKRTIDYCEYSRIGSRNELISSTHLS
ncbi:hypothetical protein Csa_016158 [Cucumis sativus]|uniref:Uncharacterized protein n=1 Tax=Cucumis sativus TaxID=3659 RepID=A0A0A0K9J3_CUCSA|nr:hypothetical protein Csa_016158 [Cucumis sativus]